MFSCSISSKLARLFFRSKNRNRKKHFNEFGIPENFFYRKLLENTRIPYPKYVFVSMYVYKIAKLICIYIHIIYKLCARCTMLKQ